ncbi:MAG: metallophosphoesterase [Polyangiaceae bacterium]
MGLVAHVTDVEGKWDKIADLARDNPAVSLEGDRLVLADGASFVFGGDAIDRGPWSRRVVATLLDAKERYGDRVVLLAGNRDINKMRLARELLGHPPKRTPPEIVAQGRVALLRWIFQNTMGAKDAFEMRRAELANAGANPVSDEDVVQSFLDDVQPDGALARYLAACQLAHRVDLTLFVHGAVTAENLGVVPGAPGRCGTADEWAASLNAFYRAQIEAFRDRRLGAHGEPLWAPLVDYQAPLPGTRLHQGSVVYGRPADPLGNPSLPPRAVVEALQRDGIGRVVVGHTPSGDAPTVLVDDGFQLVIADNSYSRRERGNQLVIDGERLRARGLCRLDDGAEHAVTCELHDLSARGPIGLRDASTGRLVKGRLVSGELLAFRFREAFTAEQIAIKEEEASRLPLVPPR